MHFQSPSDTVLKSMLHDNHTITTNHIFLQMTNYTEQTTATARQTYHNRSVNTAWYSFLHIFYVEPSYYSDGWLSSGGQTTSVCNQPSRSTQRDGKWAPAKVRWCSVAGSKGCSIFGWVAGKLCDPSLTHAVPEHCRDEFTQYKLL